MMDPNENNTRPAASAERRLARAIPASNQIKSYYHCRRCFEEMPRGQSMRTWARIEAGWTALGFQVRCVRHDINLMHVDFEGQQHPTNLTSDDLTPENAKPAR